MYGNLEIFSLKSISRIFKRGNSKEQIIPPITVIVMQ